MYDVVNDSILKQVLEEKNYFVFTNVNDIMQGININKSSQTISILQSPQVLLNTPSFFSDYESISFNTEIISQELPCYDIAWKEVIYLEPLFLEVFTIQYDSLSLL